MDLDHERRLTEVESRSKSNMKRLAEMDERYTKKVDEMRKRQDNLEDLVTTVRVLADREERVEADVSEIKNDVKEMKAKPGKRWDGLVDKVILTIAAAVVGFVLAKLGLGV